MPNVPARILALLKPGETVETNRTFRYHEPRGVIWLADVWYLPTRKHVVGAESPEDIEGALVLLLEKLEARRAPNA